MIYFVEQFGRNWAEISSKCDAYFQDRTSRYLINKYRHLENNPSLLETLKKNSLYENIKASFKPNEIVNVNHHNNQILMTKRRRHRKKAIDWTDKETLNLVFLVEKIGRSWVCIRFYKIRINFFK